MLRRLWYLLFTATLLIAVAYSKAEGPAFRQIDAIVQTLSDISGLSETHPVAYGRMNKRHLRRFLTRRIKHTLHPEEIRADELALKMFGLVPPSFDLKRSTIDLLTEQAAAFYDYDEKKLFLLEGSSASAEVTTLAHELSHALADQHFDLGKYMDDPEADDDESLAHSAVVEGQASWLMIAYEMKQAGQAPVPTPQALQALQSSGDASLGDYPVLKASPLYIQESLLFPYTEGTLFFDAVFRKEGKAAFSNVFRDAPYDAAQILHPERYFAHTRPVRPDLPVVPGLRDAPKLTEGNVGEFDHSILLQQSVGRPAAKQLAPHLSGGRFRIVGSGAEQRPVLLYASVWDSDESAREFFAAYQSILQGKWTLCEPSVQREDRFSGEGDNGYFVTSLSGRVVTSIEGLAVPLDQEGVRAGLSRQSLTVSRIH